MGKPSGQLDAEIADALAEREARETARDYFGSAVDAMVWDGTRLVDPRSPAAAAAQARRGRYVPIESTPSAETLRSRARREAADLRRIARARSKR